MADLGHIAVMSGVELRIDGNRVPMSGAVRERWGSSALRVAATAGDDYEIAFTCRAADRQKVLAAAKKSRTPVTEIGRARKGKGVALLLDKDGRILRLPSKGYEHF